MKALDLRWMDKKDWWEYKDGVVKIRKDAPKEAQESYQHYLKQVSNR